MPPVSCSITVTRTTTAKCPPKCPKWPLLSVECCLKGSYHQTDLSATDSFGYVLPWRGHSPARGPAQRGAAFFSSDVLNAGLVRGAGGRGGGLLPQCARFSGPRTGRGSSWCGQGSRQGSRHVTCVTLGGPRYTFERSKNKMVV